MSLQGTKLNNIIQPSVNKRDYYPCLELIITFVWPVFSDH